jgi:hypothetical protein
MPTNSSTQETSTGPSLSEVTAVGRKVLKYAVIFIVGYMVLKMMVSAFSSYWRATHPQPPPPPTVGFGQLPAINFPASRATPPSQYQLEMPNGRLPNFGDRAKVFFMPRSAPNLLADERVRQIASRYDFTTEPKILNPNQYRWTQIGALETVFEINLDNYNFTLTTDYLSRPELANNQRLLDKYEAVSNVKAFLSKTNLLADDVATNSAQVTYLKALSGELMEAVSLSNADFLQVDLNRVPVDGQYQMYTPRGREGVISAILTQGVKQHDSIVELKYRYQEVDYSQVETYPLKTTHQAWQELKNNQGYLVSTADQESPSQASTEDNAGQASQAVVRQVELGYFDAFREQSYLQPIYVFTGDDDFMAYVPAIADDFIKQEADE